MNNKTWNEVADILKHSNHTTIKSMCQDLKCDRQWVTKNIIPCIAGNVIDLSSGYKERYVGEPSKNTWNNSIRNKMGKCWYNDQEYYNFLYSNSFCSRQSISIPFYLLQDNFDEYLLKQTELLEEYDYCEDNFKLEEAKSTKRKLLKNRLDSLSAFGRRIYNENKFTVKNMNKLPSYEVPIPWNKLNSSIIKDCWIAVHDIMDYGELENTYYRKFNSEGYIKLELKVNEKSARTYYIKDTFTNYPVLNSLAAEKFESQYIDYIINDTITLDYGTWLKHSSEIIKNYERNNKMEFRINSLEKDDKFTELFIEELKDKDRFHKFKKDYVNYYDGCFDFKEFYNDFDRADTSRDIEREKITEIEFNKSNKKITITYDAYACVEIGYATNVLLHGYETEERFEPEISEDEFDSLMAEYENGLNAEFINKISDIFEEGSSGFGDFYSIEID